MLTRIAIVGTTILATLGVPGCGDTLYTVKHGEYAGEHVNISREYIRGVQVSKMNIKKEGNDGTLILEYKGHEYKLTPDQYTTKEWNEKWQKENKNKQPKNGKNAVSVFGK